MIKLTLLLMIVGTVVALAQPTEPTEYIITSGHFSSNPVEANEGYFAINQTTMIMVKQDSPAHLRMKELANKPNAIVELVIRVLN